ncbi:unnamed protein product [marine sediment metagenome]|uniref:Uncharacterized protein n=1 Tax=marine sediment metagenome TaxID=412755 RepID=X1GNV4_9ZZZZ
MKEQERYKVPAVIDVTATLVPIDVDAAVARWKAYQRLCKEILDEDDYVTIGGKKARKRSGWRKLARFMGVSIEILSEERWERGDTFGYTFTVRASTRDGQFEDGDGLCDSSDMPAKIKATEHNVRSKALTRAKNRATADLIGGGEVSAEELENGGNKPQRQQKKDEHPNGADWTKTVNWPSFWIHWKDKGITEEFIHRAANVSSMKDYPGTKDELKAAVDALIAAEIEASDEAPTGEAAKA